MTITVLLFASYADALGADTVAVDLRAGSTVGDLVERLGALAGRTRLPAAPLVAVNQTYAPYDHVLAASDEVAVIPPVAGG